MNHWPLDAQDRRGGACALGRGHLTEGLLTLHNPVGDAGTNVKQKNIRLFLLHLGKWYDRCAPDKRVIGGHELLGEQRDALGGGLLVEPHLLLSTPLTTGLAPG